MVVDRPRDRSIGASGELGISQPPFSSPDSTAIHICHSQSWVQAVLSPRLRAALAMFSPGNTPPICYLSTSVAGTETTTRPTSAIATPPAYPSRDGNSLQSCQLNSMLTWILIQQLSCPVLLQPSGCPPVHFRGELTPTRKQSGTETHNQTSNRRIPRAPSPSSSKSRSASPKNSSASASGSSKPSPRSRRSSPK
jgi:hypothetical protein